MIAFEKEFYLHALWIIPALLILYLLHVLWRRKARQRAGDPVQINIMMPGRSSILSILKFLLLLVSVASLILALANPQITSEQYKGHGNSEVEIVFTVDLSNSMMAADVVPSRLAQTQALLTNFFNQLNGEQAGIVIFAGRAFTYVPLTSDYQFLSNACKNLSPELIHRQGTSFAEALKLSAASFSRVKGNKKIIYIISDGESHTNNYKRIADSLLLVGIHLFAVGVGTDAGGYVPLLNTKGAAKFKVDKTGKFVVSRIHEASLKTITGNISGHYQRLENKEYLKSIFIERLAKLKQSKSRVTMGKRDLFSYFLIAALILLVLELLVPQGILRIKPATKTDE